MNRRGFLAGMLIAGAAPAIVRAASLMPVRPIALPTFEEVIDIAYGRPVLSMADITRESLRILHQKLTFIDTANRQFDAEFRRVVKL